MRHRAHHALRRVGLSHETRGRDQGAARGLRALSETPPLPHGRHRPHRGGRGPCRRRSRSRPRGSFADRRRSRRGRVRPPRQRELLPRPPRERASPGASHEGPQPPAGPDDRPHRGALGPPRLALDDHDGLLVLGHGARLRRGPHPPRLLRRRRHGRRRHVRAAHPRRLQRAPLRRPRALPPVRPAPQGAFDRGGRGPSRLRGRRSTRGAAERASGPDSSATASRPTRIT